MRGIPPPSAGLASLRAAGNVRATEGTKPAEEPPAPTACPTRSRAPTPTPGPRSCAAALRALVSSARKYDISGPLRARAPRTRPHAVCPRHAHRCKRAHSRARTHVCTRAHDRRPTSPPATIPNPQPNPHPTPPDTHCACAVWRARPQPHGGRGCKPRPRASGGSVGICGHGGVTRRGECGVGITQRVIAGPAASVVVAPDLDVAPLNARRQGRVWRQRRRDGRCAAAGSGRHLANWPAIQWRHHRGPIPGRV